LFSDLIYPLLSVEDVKYKGFELPSTVGYVLTGKKMPKRSPVPDENCTGCGRCKEICPKDAIEID
jgi:ferredoxin